MRHSALSLAHLGDNLDIWSRSPLHPTLLPIGFLALVHAVRVSHATRQVAGSHKNKLGVWQSFLLNQILMFGGVIISGMLLGIPSPLFSGWPVVVLYGGAHLVLEVTGLGRILLEVQDNDFAGTLMDLSFALLDGILRAEGIIDLGVEPVRQHPSPVISSSLFAILLNSAVVGGGVPLLIDLFRLDSSTGDWNIRSPIWAKNPFSGTNDLFSSGFLAFVYTALSSPVPGNFPVIGGVIQSFGGESLSAKEVRTLCSLLLGAILLAEKATVLARSGDLALKPKKINGVVENAKVNGHKNGTANGGTKKQKAKKQQ